MLPASTFGEQAVVADAMHTLGQHVGEKTADELEGIERHLLVSIAALDAVVLPLEGDALLDQAIKRLLAMATRGVYRDTASGPPNGRLA